MPNHYDRNNYENSFFYRNKSLSMSEEVPDTFKPYSGLQTSCSVPNLKIGHKNDKSKTRVILIGDLKHFRLN
uniref:Uncharacterized protein n=1 Tax=Strongyloides venezuelensis TaxID=75913 RepID=A0A0K0FRR2_STRVS